uniref:Major facilitator superfamily (MFS) profile domain-containing protein n=1 Tax=Castor canadensis TaxID=51338 RepID=A0A8C0XXF5_CASCN
MGCGVLRGPLKLVTITTFFTSPYLKYGPYFTDEGNIYAVGTNQRLWTGTLPVCFEDCTLNSDPTAQLQGFGRPRVYHAAVVIFLEFFAWGLLTTPMLTVLHETFPQHTFLMNGLIQGVKGLLSFLSAPLIGALSDVWGRKPFLLGTVFFTCFPIPLMRISHGEWLQPFTVVSLF